MNPVFKIGDTFALPVQFINTETNDGLELTQDMEISAKIINSMNQIIATPAITVYPDQSENKGFILLEVDPLITNLWKAGSAMFDIKLMMNGQIKHSQDFKFQIQRSIT